MSTHASRTISANRIHPPVCLTANITSPNSYRRSPRGDFPIRSSTPIRKASKAVKSNPQVSSKINSIKPQFNKRSPTSGSSTRITVHSKENDITANSASARTTVAASRHLRNSEKATGGFIKAHSPVFSRFAYLPDYIIKFSETILARHEAAKSRSQSQQPSPGSHASSDARGRNYSARSAKRKPLSGAAASSRKRSSGA